jgi:hypothetical protein
MPLRALLALALAVPLAACGGGTAQLASGRIALRLDEFTITPRTVTVPAGPIQITARNYGVLTHDVALESRTNNSTGAPTVYAIVRTLLPGQSGASKTLYMPAGRYVLVSTIANQGDLGMNGTLIVR